MPEMTPTGIVAVKEPHTGEIIKKSPWCFKRGEHSLQNCILQLEFKWT